LTKIELNRKNGRQDGNDYKRSVLAQGYPNLDYFIVDGPRPAELARKGSEQALEGCRRRSEVFIAI